MKKYIFVFIVGLFIFSCGFGEHPKTTSILVELSTDKAVYSIGNLVKTKINAVNHSKSTISSFFPSSQQFDIGITDKNGNEVWRWSYGKMFLMEIQQFSLRSGDNISFETTWDQKDNKGTMVIPGDYTVIGEMKADRVTKRRQKG